MREENDRDSNLKILENKNAKALFLNFKFRNLINLIVIITLKRYIFIKITKVNEKTNSKLNIKIYFIFIIIKKII